MQSRRGLHLFLTNTIALIQQFGLVPSFFEITELQMPSFLNVTQIWGSKRVIAQVFFMLCAGPSLAVTPTPQDRHGLGLLANGQIVGWGNNEFAQVQAGQAAYVVEPVRLTLPGIKFVSVASGSRHSLAIDETGKIWAWGDNSSGQLGLGHTRPVTDPTAVTGLTGRARVVVAGTQHSAALMAGGTVWVWGANNMGQTGSGTANAFAVQTTPLRLAALSRVEDLASGNDFMLALVVNTQETVGKRDKVKAKGLVWVWGTGMATPRVVDVIKDATVVRAAGDIAMVRTATDSYWRLRANQAPVIAQRQVFDSLLEMTHPNVATLNAQINTEKQTKPAATVPTSTVANDNSGPIRLAAVVNNSTNPTATSGKTVVLASRNTAPFLTAPIIAALPAAAPQAVLPIPTAVVAPSTQIVSAPAIAIAPAASVAPVMVAPARVNLSGTVRLSSGFGGDAANVTGAVMENVQVSAEGAQCSATDGQGRYNCVVPAGWTGQVSVQRINYRFTPSSLSFQNLRTNAGRQDFAAIYEPR